jgi:HEPN domain-containing protein
MDRNKRKLAEGWLDTASTQLDTARQHVKTRVYYPEAVQAAQQCVELSVKAILVFLEIDFQKSHGWDKEKLTKIAEQIRDRELMQKLQHQHVYMKLPRLLFLANFWEQFYLLAKYGMEAGHLATARELFEKEDAELAVQHAQDCYHAATHLRHLSEDKMNAILS